MVGKSQSIEHLAEKIRQQDYIADLDLVTALYLALKLQKPILLEGEPGCGKTDIAKVLANLLSAELIRLQCYEGIDASHALYEWNYPKQILAVRIAEHKELSSLKMEIFSDEFLLKRPLLAAIMREANSDPPVLLIDEIDRADEEFEGILLEFLSEFQISIPERGTIRADKPPIVVITSNQTRDLSDALRRRCIYTYLGYPSLEKELSIVQLKVPELDDKVTRQICAFMQEIRDTKDIIKKPGVSETLDWAKALLAFGINDLSPKVVKDTLSCIIKTQEDRKSLRLESFKTLHSTGPA